ncbi:cytochrome c oxidase, cbb3-type, CcoQ subunit [Sulfurovum sp. ST-21]|uniref:Cytochrome c oxidase, cbb3-type, CcoQ subunit n=1 Tax=Sulfurovum indicum TaxID=2779528 RepID=A0A7M1S323_9BACT|nr:cytochrome c oxidase, cbb3-type, CcoQ subunit [Sulfurovum indicum]QOR61736.1 cytochrome c oxidase, cbb3-type, CcoQ subunit [Sulfurovum indicum]
MDIRELQAYGTFFMTIFLVVMLYGYIIYLYRSEKKGEKDYEKLGNIAIDDEIDSDPVNSSDPLPSDNKEQNK